MKIKSKILLLFLFAMITIASVSAVHASESDAGSIQSDACEIELEERINKDISSDLNDNEEYLLEDNENNGLSLLEENMNNEPISQPPKNFSALNDLINSNNNSTVTLNDDYSYDSETDNDFINGIKINRSLTIEGNNHIINGSSIAKGFNVSAKDVTFNRIIFTNFGNKDSIDNNYNGSAIYSNKLDNDAFVLNSKFYECYAENGGATYQVHAKFSTFKNCNATGYGGAMYDGNATNCSFESNYANFSGGGKYRGTTINSTFLYNYGRLGGGSALLKSINSTYIGNRAYAGGGHYDNFSFVIVHCNFSNNNASDCGSAYYNEIYQTGDLIDCTFENNYAGYGAVIRSGNIYMSIFENNTSRYNIDFMNFAEIKPVKLNAPNLTVYPSNPVELPMELYIDFNHYLPIEYYPNYTYYFNDIPLQINLTKGEYSEIYNCTSGTVWTINLSPGIYTARITVRDPYKPNNTIKDNVRTITVLPDNSFSNLNGLINNYSIPEIVLDKDYQFYSDFDSDFINGIIIARNITINGNGHTINGSTIAKGFNVSGDVTFKNIKFCDLGTLNEDNSNNGGVIYNEMSSNDVKIINSTFYNCIANNGGAIYNANAENCNFSFCQANEFGGAIYSGNAINCNFNNNKVSIGNANGGAIYWGNAINCSFHQNEAKFGGATYGANAENCIFTENNATSGGAFYGSKNNITNCNFTQNRASNDGGAVMNEAQIINSIFTNNSAGRNGGAVRSEGEIIGCNFTNNHADENGGAIYLRNGNTLNSNMENNTATNGGGVFSDGGSLINSTIINNTATQNGGGVYGGNIVLCEFKDNSAPNGSNSYESEIKKFTAIPESFTVSCKSQIIPIDVAYGNYTLDGIEVSIEVIKNDESIGNYSALSGQSWIADLEAGTYILKFGIESPEPAESYCNLIVEGIKTKIIGQDMEIAIGENKYMNVRLTNEDNETMPNRKITVRIDEDEETHTTNELGELNIPLRNLGLGIHYISFEFNGNVTYKDAYNYFIVMVMENTDKINTQIIANEISIFNGDPLILIAYLKEIDGTPIKDENLIIQVETLSFNLKTDANGQIRLDLTNSLSSGTFNANINFDGDERYEKASTDIKISIKRIQTALLSSDIIFAYSNGKYLKAILKDIYGNSLSNQQVSITLNGKSYLLTTDMNGQAALSLDKLVPKTYYAKISYVGSEKYTSSSIITKILIKKASLKLTAKSKKYRLKRKVKKYTVILRTSNGKAMKNITLRMKFKHKTYKAKTNKKGKATFKINKLNKKGRFNAYIKFAGNQYYNAFNKHVKITVRK